MLRSLIQHISPGFAARVEAESRQWMVSCLKCGDEISVWESGGIRYKARGTVYRMGKCRRCGQTGRLKIYRPGPGSTR